jgi:hypothetical protein
MAHPARKWPPGCLFLAVFDLSWRRGIVCLITARSVAAYLGGQMIITPAQPARQARPAFILACCWALGIGGTTMMPLLVTNAMARLRLD